MGTKSILQRTSFGSKAGSAAARSLSLSTLNATALNSSAPPPSPSQKVTFASQKDLPLLPVPTLDETLERYLASVRGMGDEAASSRTEVLVKDFAESELSQKLQVALEAKAAHARPSWLEEWWDAGYLEARCANPLNINYAFLMTDNPAPHASADMRAARLIAASCEFRQSVMNESLEPSMTRAGPQCMSEFVRTFATARVPHQARDTITTYQPNAIGFGKEPTSSTGTYAVHNSRHVVVQIHGRFYKLQVANEDGSPLSVSSIFMGLQNVRNHDAAATTEAPRIGVFTALDRDTWAELRDEIEGSSVGNAESLHEIDTALFMVSLRDQAEDVASQDRDVLMDRGVDTWFDKHSCIVNKDGSVGFNMEHAIGDGTTSLRWVDYLASREVELASAPASASDKEVAPMAAIDFVLSEKVQEAVEEAMEEVQETASNVDQTLLQVGDIGGSTIKALKVSPDAFVQAVFQVAHHEVNGAPAVTYESAATKGFLHGRTETIRSLSEPMFALATKYSLTEDPIERSSLIRDACNAHSGLLREAKKGLGVDRHLLGLKLICSEEVREPLPAMFTDPVFSASQTWELSTSHCGSDGIRAFTFGPVVSGGYGIGYAVHRSHIDFSVTGLRDGLAEAGKVPSAEFAQAINTTLHSFASDLEKQVASPRF